MEKELKNITGFGKSKKRPKLLVSFIDAFTLNCLLPVKVLKYKFQKAALNDVIKKKKLSQNKALNLKSKIIKEMSEDASLNQLTWMDIGEFSLQVLFDASEHIIEEVS